MKKMIFLLAAIAICGIAQASSSQSIGFVNFKNCVEKSKAGKQEKNAFEAMKKQMTDTLDKAEKELNDIAKKLEDQDYMDTLSDAAEAELNQKFDALSQEFARYQNQYYQLLNQANYRMLQTLHSDVSKAADKIRDKRQLSLIVSEDSTFSVAPSLEVTDEVIAEMDAQYDLMHSEVVQSGSGE